MGDGAIDGRGGATLLGLNVSWWDLAKEAKIKDLSQNVTRVVIVRQSDNFTLYCITLRNGEWRRPFARFPEIPAAPEAAVTIPAEDKTLYVSGSGTGPKRAKYDPLGRFFHGERIY